MDLCPTSEIAAAVYAIADILRKAPTDPIGQAVIAEEALVMALAGRGFSISTSRDAVQWAKQRGYLQVFPAPDGAPLILNDTCGLRQIGNGECEELLGRNPNPAEEEAVSTTWFSRKYHFWLDPDSPGGLLFDPDDLKGLGPGPVPGWSKGRNKGNKTQLDGKDRDDGSKSKPRKRKPGKWDHVWQIIEDEHAVEACGKDQKIANRHNKVCANGIDNGNCTRIDAKKVAQIRYEHKHLGRHRKQNHKKRS